MHMQQSKRHTVLIADDHYLVGEAFSQFLGQSGLYETTLVRDVLEARVELRVNGPFDIVLLDLSMPGMDGPETIAELVQRNAGGRVVVLTGGNSRFPQSAIFGAGASGLILKSQPARQIVDALQSILDGEIYFPLADDRLLDRVTSTA
jgi:DNA-binding NarL/FixJ family response regulator